ncbi:hypothetical protein [Sphingomonas montanisoli]|uniref:Uncharacterized protein n=1 Tax=Sphingomonas montanisoli TaxID=2606412 RepID=A0A5D9BYY2_9SPHN|nr:hypothetical protein [Sphingomonas montanisoli]TZG24117.1 hypothetical protein FYJ91_19985 [Sphingomonas montanisoli]
MTDFAARVRRVRMKDGADVHVLHTPRVHKNENGDPENLLGKIVQHAKQVVDFDTEGSRLDGFLIIGFFDDGSSSLSFRTPDRLPSALIPAYVTELVRRDTVVNREAERVFDAKFEWVER